MDRRPQIIETETLRPHPLQAPLFEGADFGDIPISFFAVDAPPGMGPKLHRHPYPEIFVVHEGTAAFQVGDEQLEVSGGRITRNTAYVDGMEVARALGMMPPQGSGPERAMVGAFNAATKARKMLRERLG